MAGRKKSNVPTRSTSLTINEAVFNAIEEVRWDHRMTFSGMVEKMALEFFAAQGTPVTLAVAPPEAAEAKDAKAK